LISKTTNSISGGESRSEKDMAAQFFIDHLGRCAGEPFAFGIYLYGGIFEHILAPVLPLDAARRHVKASLIINKVEFYRPSRPGLTSYGR